jgi:two-component system sensor histidine kinase SenX3
VDTSAIIAISGAIGGVGGAAVAYLWRFSEKQQQEIVEPTAVVPAGAELVLSVLASSAVLIDSSDTVVQASAPAFVMGLINNDRLESEQLMSLVRQVRRDGQVREANLSLQAKRGGTVFVHARVAPLTSRLILVLADDHTREHRVESIRRDFVANVSHELKTPVGALILLAEAVGEAKDDPEAIVRFSQRMHLESERLTRLVQQIIDLSRLQDNALSNEASAIKVSDLISQACEHSATEAEHKDIEIVPAGGHELYVHGDRAQLHAAVSNLVENAVTYSPTGSRVSITGQLDGADVRLTVADNGIGIPEDELERIFERFYRVDPARARATGGTGLGLSIVKHVAASNSGTVEVWSEPGLGSSFTLVLPAHHLDTEEENP